MSSTSPTQLVPYGAPTGSVTPPQGPFTQGDQPTMGQPVASGQPSQDDPVKKLLAALIQQKQQPQLAQPVPAPINSPRPMQPVTGHGSAPGNLVEIVGSVLQGSIANKKKSELAKAESDWNQLSAVMQSGGPEKAQLWLAQNDKAAKNMAKALNQDWLNPEKTTVYKQALDNVTRQQQAKGKAASGIKSMVMHLLGRSQNPQLTDDQKMAIAKEQMSKAPMATPATDPKTMIEMYKALGEEAYRDKSLALDQQRVDIEKDTSKTAAKRADIEDKRYSEDLEYKYDQLASQHQDRLAALDEKKSSDAERSLALQSTLDLRQQMIDLSKQRLDASLAGAGTPKERQTEWKGLFDDLDKRRASDNQILGKAGTIASLTGSKAKIQETVDRDNAASALARKLQSDVIAGRIDPTEAKNKVYSVYDQGTKIFPMSKVKEMALQNKIPVADLQKSLEAKGAVVY